MAILAAMRQREARGVLQTQEAASIVPRIQVPVQLIIRMSCHHWPQELGRDCGAGNRSHGG